VSASIIRGGGMVCACSSDLQSRQVSVNRTKSPAATVAVLFSVLCDLINMDHPPVVRPKVLLSVLM
jgi:hypothetical protein